MDEKFPILRGSIERLRLYQEQQAAHLKEQNRLYRELRKEDLSYLQDSGALETMKKVGLILDEYRGGVSLSRTGLGIAGTGWEEVDLKLIWRVSSESRLLLPYFREVPQSYSLFPPPPFHHTEYIDHWTEANCSVKRDNDSITGLSFNNDAMQVDKDSPTFKSDVADALQKAIITPLIMSRKAGMVRGIQSLLSGRITIPLH